MSNVIYAEDRFFLRRITNGHFQNRSLHKDVYQVDNLTGIPYKVVDTNIPLYLKMIEQQFQYNRGLLR